MIGFLKCWLWYVPRNLYYGRKWKREYNNFQNWF